MKIAVPVTRQTRVSKQKTRAKRKFLYYFPGGFTGQKYRSWERDYKWNAHLAWTEQLGKKEYERMLGEKDFLGIAKKATALESKTNLLFSFEKMALRDGVKTAEGARLFSEGLYDFVYGKEAPRKRFEAFTEVLGQLPRKQTRVLTWPLQTVFGFIADPSRHIFLKPQVTKRAAEKYGYDFNYRSMPNWDTYKDLLDFAATIREDISALKPADMIDIQSFIWVLGSEEYPD